jgi:hypothetical protein
MKQQIVPELLVAKRKKTNYSNAVLVQHMHSNQVAAYNESVDEYSPKQVTRASTFASSKRGTSLQKVSKLSYWIFTDRC